MAASLTGKQVALLVASGSEQGEWMVVRDVLAEAGCPPTIISPKKQDLRLWMNSDWGAVIPIDLPLADCQAADFDALVIPGGVLGCDVLRADRQAVALVRDLVAQHKPVAAMSHAVWLLIEAGAVSGRIVTSAESIRTDVANAGGVWVNDPAASDRGVITGRHRHDLPDWLAAMAEELAREG